MKMLFLPLCMILLSLCLNACGGEDVSDPQDGLVSQTPSETVELEKAGLMPTPPINNANKETIYSTDGNFAFQSNRIFLSYGDGIYSMNTDGGDKRKLTENWSSWFRVVGDRIYYAGYAGALYSVNTDGSDNKKLNDNSPSGLFDNVIGDKMYYSNNYDDFTFYTMNADGSDNKKLNDDFPLYI